MSSDALSIIKSSTKLSQYVVDFCGGTLKPNGTGKYRAACVAHGGDNPSGMSIDDNLGLWHCFTGECKGGSIIDLYMAVNDVTDFGEAIEGLASQMNVTLPEREESSKPSKSRVHSALAAVAEAASNYLFTGQDDDARAVRRYLKERGITKGIANRWQLGFLPPQEDAIDFVLDAANDRPALVEGGVITVGTHGDWVNMNGRLLFPIADSNGKTVAFGARIIEGVSHSMAGKYVNTSETSTYSKSHVLYGMDLVDKNTEHIVVVEGYLDTIAVNESLPDNTTVAVATCGTAVAEGHVAYLNKFKSITMVFDGDTAGNKAAVKSMWTANKLGDRVSVVRLDQGLDPWDMYLEGSDRLSNLPREALPIMSVVVQSQWAILDESERDLTGWVQAIVPSLSYSHHRDSVIADAARILGQNVSAYRKQLALPVNLIAHRNAAALDALSPHTKILCAALIQMSPDERDGILAGLRPWSSRIESAVQNWLPASSSIDTEVIKRLALGMEAQASPQADQIIASLMNSDEREDLCLILRGMAKQLLATISSMATVHDSLVSQIKNIRRSLEASRNRKLQPTILAYLIDTSVDVERVNQLALSSSPAAAHTA